MARLTSALLLLFVLACGCTSISPSQTDNESVTVFGRYVTTFEVSAFKPNDINETWWLSDPDGLVRPRMKAPTGLYGGIAQITISGKLSSRGRHGHLGQYYREIIVTKLNEFKLVSNNPHGR